MSEQVVPAGVYGRSATNQLAHRIWAGFLVILGLIVPIIGGALLWFASLNLALNLFF